jgi:transcriptional regulator with XRE-family HTH domain
MTIADLIKSAREAKKWTQADLARAVGVTRNAVTQWEAGESAPKRGRQDAVARALGIPVTAFSPLQLSGVALVDELEQKVVNLPLYKMSAITMRTGGELKLGKSEGYIVANHNFGASCIAARVSDEAMSPLFQMGDEIIIDRSLSPRDKDAVVAGLPGDVLMLRYYKALGQNSRGQEVYELRSTNADYPTIPMDSVKGLCIVGVVVEHRRKRRATGAG